MTLLTLRPSAYRYPPYMYTEAGRKFTDRLWNETRQELRGKGVEEILKAIDQKS